MNKQVGLLIGESQYNQKQCLCNLIAVCLLLSFSLPQNYFILLCCKVTCIHLIVGGCDFCFPWCLQMSI